MRPQREHVKSPANPALRFTPYAWAKLEFFCDLGESEIGGFGIAPADDLLLVEDFVTIKQRTSCVSVAFDDESVADFFEAQVDVGRKPEQFGRIWLHSHPGDSPIPSSVDEETFVRVFGRCDWAVMFVLARNGQTYARLRFNVGPKGELLIPVQVDFSVPFAGSDHEAWEEEYERNIHEELLGKERATRGYSAAGSQWPEWPERSFEDELPAHEEMDLWDEREVIS